MSSGEIAGALFGLCSLGSGGDADLERSPAVDHSCPGSARRSGSDIMRERLTSYRVHERVGDGTDSLVYRAIEKATLRVVAIKYMPKRGRSHTAVSRFRLEGHLLCDVLRHPHIAAGHAWSDTDDAVTVVLEFMEGGSLRDFVNDVGRPLRDEELRRILGQLVDALSFAHSAGYVHHDVKPENVLIGPGPDLNVKLCDWAYACRIGELDAPGHRGGSMAYTAPEIFVAARRSPSEEEKLAATRPPLDVWSLGATLYAVSFKILPFGFEEKNIQERRFVACQSELHPSRPFDFHALVGSMLRVEVSRRITLDRIREHPWFMRTPSQ